MNRTNVKMRLPFRICDRCSELNVDAKLSSVGHYGWQYANDEMGTATRDVIVTCKNYEICERLYQMISEEVAQAQSGGDGVDKTVD